MSNLDQILADAVGLARLQEWLDTIESHETRKYLVMQWHSADVITAEETELLIDHNGLVSA